LFVNSLKTPILGGSRSFKAIDVDTTGKLVGSKSVSICNRFHARRPNSGKITISKGGTPLWCHRSRGISSLSSTKLSH